MGQKLRNSTSWRLATFLIRGNCVYAAMPTFWLISYSKVTQIIEVLNLKSPQHLLASTVADNKSIIKISNDNVPNCGDVSKQGFLYKETQTE